MKALRYKLNDYDGTQGPSFHATNYHRFRSRISVSLHKNNPNHAYVISNNINDFMKVVVLKGEFQPK